MLSAEIPSIRLRNIIYRRASMVNILTQFTVTISMPYLLNEPYAALGTRVGFIFDSAALLFMVSIYICLPECEDRSLEETALHNRMGNVAIQEPDAKGGSIQVKRV